MTIYRGTLRSNLKTNIVRDYTYQKTTGLSWAQIQKRNLCSHAVRNKSKKLLDSYCDGAELVPIQTFVGSKLLSTIFPFRFEDDAIMPESGNDDSHFCTDIKAARRSAKTRSRASNRMEKEKFKHSVQNKEWSARVRAQLRKDVKKSNNAYHPESGLECIGADDLDLSQYDVYGKRIEDLFLYLAQATSSLNLKQFILCTVTYLKTFSDKSISLWFLKNIVSVICGDKSLPDDGSCVTAVDTDDFEYFSSLTDETDADTLYARLGLIVPESAAVYSEKFCQALRSLSSNFKSVAANPVFSKISYIISSAMCLGLLENSKMKWSIAGVTLFSQQALMRQVKAPDLICAICDTFAYFIEGGIEFFRTGSLAAFIYNDGRVAKLNEEVCFLEANVDHVRSGTLMKFKGISNSDFDHRLTQATDQVKELCRALDGVERTIMTQKLTKLHRVRFDFDTLRVSGGSREAPYTLQLFGPTKVGKSNLTSILAVAIGKMNNYAVDDDRIVTLNADDKFQSTMRGDTNVIIIDDLFNTKADFLQTAPTAIINTIANNARAYCNMAEVEMKGKIPYENKLLIINTNLHDMGASMGSNEPASIQRRAHLKIDVSVKPQFRQPDSHVLDANLVSEHYRRLGIKPPVVEDLWNFKVAEPVVIKGRGVGSKDEVMYRVLSDPEGEMESISLKRMLRFIKTHSASYYRHETERVIRQNNLSDRIHLCQKCKNIELCCTCVEPEGLTIGDAELSVSELVESARNSVIRHLPDFLIAFLVRWYFGVTPTDTMSFKANITRCAFLMVYLTTCLVFEREKFLTYLLFVIFFMIVEHSIRSYVTIIASAAGRKNIIKHLCKKTRENRLKITLLSFGALVTIYHLAKRYVLAARLYNTFAQGSLQPSCEEEVKARDKEVNIWAKVSVPDRHIPHNLATATTEQVSGMVFNNLCVLRITEGENHRVCNAFVVRSNVFIMPYHMLFPCSLVNAGKVPDEPESLQISMQRRKPQTGGATVYGYISKSHWHRVPDTDFLVVTFPNLGSYADLTKLLPTTKYVGPCRFLHKNPDGSKREEGVNVTPTGTRHAFCSFDGYEYFVAGGTSAGLCMSVLIAQTTGPHVCGFHLGGTRTGSGKAVGGYISKQQFEDSMKVLEDSGTDVPLFIPASAGVVPDTQYGKPVVTTTELNPKSPINFLTDSDGVVPLGSCNGGVTATSRVVPTLITDSVAKHTGVKNGHDRPQFKPSWAPWQQTLEVVGVAAPGFKQESIDWAVEDFTRDIFKNMDENKYVREMCGTLDIVQNINGIPGVRFIDSMVSKTSAGYPLSGAKEQFFEHHGPDDDKIYGDVVLPNAEIMEEVSRLEAAYLSHERGYPVYKASLKDEPTKIGKTKVRVIYCAPIALQILCRKYFLRMTRMFQMFPLLHESAVGINCAGPEWNTLREHCTYDGTNLDRGFGVDYGRYDSRMPAQVTVAVNRVFMAIARRSGQYTEEDLTIMNGILTDSTFPIVAFNGTIVEYLLSFISGDTLTVHKNNVGNGIVQRTGWYEIEVLPRRAGGDALEDESYRAHVRASDYGDDVQGTIKDDVKHFNMKSYSEMMAIHGIVVTMPDKSDEMKPFLHWNDMDFLKRHDSYIPEIDATVGKLDYLSVFKSLHRRLDSKNVSKEEHACAVLEGAAGEFFLHGKEVYDDIVSKLILVEQDHKLFVPGLHKTFEDRVTEWNSKYRPDLETSIERRLSQDSDNPSECDIVAESGYLLGCALDYSHVWDSCVPVYNLYNDPIFIGCASHSTLYNYSRAMGLTRVLREPGNFIKDCFEQRGTDHSTQTSGTQGMDVPHSEDYVSSTDSQSFTYSSDEEILPQASSAFEIMDVSNKNSSTITQFDDINPGQTYAMGDTSDTTFGVADEPMDDLTHFFKRPIIIQEVNWLVDSAVLGFQFNPWRSYMNNPRVANRMTNFRNFRGRLHLKFVLNGNQFMYGLAMAAYTPRPTVDDFPAVGQPGTDLIRYSQQPHVYLDPNLSQGGDMVCPFFWNRNSVDLTSTEMDNLGQINIVDVATLRHSQGGLSPITITVFAWMEEVVLSCPTASPIDGLVPQSGTGDEYGMSPAKKIAESVAKAAGMLRDRPIIGPYARATEMVSKVGLGVASAMGFSKPNCIDAITPIKHMTCGSLANTNVPDMTQKLTLDSKQEVSIDPRTTGLSGEDEMDLVALACRESYLTQFTWSPGESPGTTLFGCRVTPQQYARGTEVPEPAVILTPSAWVVAPFAYWRGSMKVRIKVCCSSYHKGRLRIAYDPNGNLATDDMNVVTNHIIDIAECKDFTFTIGWNQPFSYCRTTQYTDPVGNFSDSALGTFGEFWNGAFRIDVLNALTTPEQDVNGIQILVFTSMCDDFEVQGPSSALIQNMTLFDPNPAAGFASGVEMIPEAGVIQDGENTCAPSLPVLTEEEPEAKMAGELLSVTDQTPNIYFGESIKNWKQVLKRYNLHRGWSIGSSSPADNWRIHNLAISDFPMYRGLASFGIDVSVDGNYNYCDTTMLNWVTPCYAGYRGGIRWKYASMYMRPNTNYGQGSAHMQVTRTPVGNLGYLNYDTELFIDPASTARLIRAQVAHTCSGATFTNRHINTTVEAELPYQSNKRFYSGRRNNPNLLNSEFPCHRFQVISGEANSHFLSYCAAGEDFQTYFFVNVPRMWVVVADPATL